jgi:DNA-binding XRE family transcriptional regulator
MDKAAEFKLDGCDYVILVREEYERLAKLARVAEAPALPAPDADGNYPAVEYLRASIARDIVRERAQAGLTQRDLANLAGVRAETLNRIETGKHTASTATIAKLDLALKRAGRRKRTRVVKAPNRNRRAS